ncbi:hypothetical protein AtubIFM56815_011005 [Aspergillus tubingensis]|uniref:Amino acid transporter transmembrane domain-containing protein n=1 Tax=Aspergillus tubingensis TaxID=5068 RepID=A0A9W6AVV4_ASPTU|nr:hypothetical protein AtubIFM56815_011005 [Aspergillus tubingensis]
MRSSEIYPAPPTVADQELWEEKEVSTEQSSLEVGENKDLALQQTQDAFGNEEFAEVKYKVLKWWQCGLLMVAETVSLGVLSLPAAVAGLGLVPSVIILVCLGGLATYTGYVIGQFKWRYPHVCNMADAGEVLAGRFGRELLGFAQIIFLIFIMASHLLTFTIAMNALTDHGTCSIVFGVVGLVVSFACSLPRTLEKMSWLSLISGHAAFFSLAAELKNPADYPKALMLLQSVDMTLYLVAAVVIYCYGGSTVTSPALGSASTVVSKVAYGIALPTIIIAGVINGHVSAKSVYVRIFRGTDHMHKRTWTAVGSWTAIVLTLWVLAWIIAEAIPVFNKLLSLVTALFASWFTFGLSAIFWFYMNSGRWFSSPKKFALSAVNLLALAVGCCLCGLGLYVSGKAIHDDPHHASFTCMSTV